MYKDTLLRNFQRETDTCINLERQIEYEQDQKCEYNDLEF